MLIIVLAAVAAIVQSRAQALPVEWQSRLRWIGWIGGMILVLAAMAEFTGYDLRTILNASRVNWARRMRLLGEIKDNLLLAERVVSGKEVIEPIKFATNVWNDVRGEAEDWMGASAYASLEEACHWMQQVNAKVEYILANPTVRTTDRKIYRDTFLRYSDDILDGLKKAKDCLDQSQR